MKNYQIIVSSKHHTSYSNNLTNLKTILNFLKEYSNVFQTIELMDIETYEILLTIENSKITYTSKEFLNILINTL